MDRGVRARGRRHSLLGADDAFAFVVSPTTTSTDASSAIFSDEQATVTLCTVHKSKGLENNRVLLLRPELLPFRHPKQTPDQRRQEENLYYVALTRAREALYFVQSG